MYLRCDWSALERSLPVSVDDITHSSILSCERMAKVLPKLRNAYDIACCLILEAHKQHHPHHVNAPCACPWVFSERGKFTSFMVFLVRQVTKLGGFAWGRFRWNVFVDLDGVGFVRHGDAVCNAQGLCLLSDVKHLAAQVTRTRGIRKYSKVYNEEKSPDENEKVAAG